MKQQFKSGCLKKSKKTAKKCIKSSIKLEETRLEQGGLGKIWGSSTSIPNNIAALLILVLVISGIIYTFAVSPDKSSLSVKEFWAIISPLITLAIGYLFGNGINNTSG